MFIKDKLVVTSAVIIIFFSGAFCASAAVWLHLRLNNVESTQNTLIVEINKFAEKVQGEIQHLKPEKK